ncbi:MAG: aconitate hydratase [Candidatus Micrarchaeia archaeon]
MQSVAEKIIRKHTKDRIETGEEIALKIDQTLTQDATGTLAYLEFEALGIPRVKTELSVSYIDHNTLQIGYENADDHIFLRTVAAKYGVCFSKAGNGICHQVHLERFSVPGKTLLGSDSHTPTCGGAGMLAIGAGGLDIALAMGGRPFYLKMPEIVGIKLCGKLQDWVSAKDVALTLLRKVTVRGGIGKLFEYYGEGVKSLSVPERATIANMGAETGATTSIFPSDETTKAFLEMQSRGDSWREIKADDNAEYGSTIEIDLSSVEPLIAKPHSPDNVCPVSDVAGREVNQIIVGSCTNSSYRDLMIVARILKGRKIHPDVSFAVVPGSRQVLEEITRNGALADLIHAGARILESACGPCIGMGMAPQTDGFSLRTFNRNFEGRSGTKSAKVYLVSPETAAASALKGAITDPRELGKPPHINMPNKFLFTDALIILPPKDGRRVKVMRGPNIKPLPKKGPLTQSLAGSVLIKLGDNITTDHIMPAGAKILPLRSNIPAISDFVFSQIDPNFAKRAKDSGGGFIVAGENYGQGSSREHAALAPMFLGVKGVIVKSFARIHRANLINFGILPLLFAEHSDYDKLKQGDFAEIRNVRKGLERRELVLASKGFSIKLKHDMTDKEVKIVLAGGMLNYARKVSRWGKR